jgi:hypothetical protein
MARRTITDADIKAKFDTVDTNLISDFYMHLQLNKHHGLKTQAKEKATQVKYFFNLQYATFIRQSALFISFFYL